MKKGGGGRHNVAGHDEQVFLQDSAFVRFVCYVYH